MDSLNRFSPKATSFFFPPRQTTYFVFGLALTCIVLYACIRLHKSLTLKMFQRSQGPHRQDKACKINLGQLYIIKKKIAPFPYNGKHLPTNTRKKIDLNKK